MLDKTFTATIEGGGSKGAWSYVAWPEAKNFFGTGKSVKVVAQIEGHEFQATFMPLGGGVAMLPLRAPIMEAAGKQLGDTVTVRLKQRL
ncbi:MAG TPA: DUF1905 domain-containing protein [Verrucomicrobiae bacterium]|nr:DUF1905 domain-containing protein [Verrucomicrobiae bacterium]